MPRYSTGQPVRLSTTVRDVNGNLITPGTLTLTIVRPDSTQVVYSSPVNDSLGQYHQDSPVTDLGQIGHYQYVWTSTGTGAGETFGDFDVFSALEVSLLPLQDAKDALNIPQATTTSDNEILQYVATIENSLERMTGGPLINRAIVSERAVLTGDYTVLQVRCRPLVSVTSIVSVASGTALDLSSGLDIDSNAGTVRRPLGYPFYGPYFVWLPAMLITYTAGWGTAAPPAFNTAARIILQNLWQTQHGPSQRPSMGLGSEPLVTMPGFGFAIPQQAAEIMEGSLNGIPFLSEAYV